MLFLTCVGSRLDSFARASLWQVGLNYPHGTGHGVGAFLNVHEGMLNMTQPKRLSYVSAVTQDHRESVVPDQFLSQSKQT